MKHRANVREYSDVSIAFRPASTWAGPGVNTTPYPPMFTPRHIGVHCSHAQFMRSYRRIDTPTCFGPPEPGSLYCVAHERTGMGTGSHVVGAVTT